MQESYKSRPLPDGLSDMSAGRARIKIQRIEGELAAQTAASKSVRRALREQTSHCQDDSSQDHLHAQRKLQELQLITWALVTLSELQVDYLMSSNGSDAGGLAALPCTQLWRLPSATRCCGSAHWQRDSAPPDKPDAPALARDELDGLRRAVHAESALRLAELRRAREACEAAAGRARDSHARLRDADSGGAGAQDGSERLRALAAGLRRECAAHEAEAADSRASAGRVHAHLAALPPGSAGAGGGGSAMLLAVAAEAAAAEARSVECAARERGTAARLLEHDRDTRNARRAVLVLELDRARAWVGECWAHAAGAERSAALAARQAVGLRWAAGVAGGRLDSGSGTPGLDAPGSSGPGPAGPF